MPGSTFARLLPTIILPLYSTITETVGGTEKTLPVFTLICDDTLDDTTVGIENQATDEKIGWTGDLVASDVLEINSKTCTIKLNGVEDMRTISPVQFPNLLPGDNILNITGFSGTLDIVYRKRYV